VRLNSPRTFRSPAREQEVALVHAPLHRAEGVLGERFALREEGAVAPQALRHRLQQVLVHPARNLAPVLVSGPSRVAPS
jgi:hypothetical protein